MNSLDRYRKIASEPRFQGWRMVGDPVFGDKIPYFGQPVSYKLETGNGTEDYTSILRHFGWASVLGVFNHEELGPVVPTVVQWKPGVNQATWELPPGGIGKISAEATPEDRLKQTQSVYQKETGLGGGDWNQVARLAIETGKYRGEDIAGHGLFAYMYIATGLEQVAGARNPNPNEIMEPLYVPVDEIGKVVDSGLFNEVGAYALALLGLRHGIVS